jgi:hypothetical protein
MRPFPAEPFVCVFGIGFLLELVPWPPPMPSASAVLPRNAVFRDAPTLGVAAARINAVHDKARYGDRRYFVIKGYFQVLAFVVTDEPFNSRKVAGTDVEVPGPLAQDARSRTPASVRTAMLAKAVTVAPRGRPACLESSQTALVLRKEIMVVPLAKTA